MQMNFVETHSHLNDDAFKADRDAVIEKTFRSGVGKIVEIACAPGEWAQGERLAAAYPGKIVCAFGAHPEYTRTLPPDLLRDLEAFMAKPCAAALGVSRTTKRNGRRNRYLPAVTVSFVGVTPSTARILAALPTRPSDI